MPKEILQALDDWKLEKEINSRSSAIVAIVANYLGVQYPVPPQSTAPLSTVLSTVLDELSQLKERVAALEQGSSTVPMAAPSTKQVSPSEDNPGNAPIDTLNTAPVEAILTSKVLNDVLDTSPLEAVPPDSKLLSNSPSTAAETVTSPQAPLTQLALAKRLGVSNHVVQKQKQCGRENFAAWSKERDPDGIAWSWQGKVWKGKPMRFVPANSNKI